MLHEVNSYIQSFRAAAELTAQQNVQVVLHGDKRLKPSEEHCRKYNLPVQSEVAALVPGETSSNLDIIVQLSATYLALICIGAPQHLKILLRIIVSLYDTLMYNAGI